jgi:hypothetical protein
MATATVFVMHDRRICIRHIKHMTGTNEGYRRKKDHGPPKVKSDLKPLLDMKIVQTDSKFTVHL